MRRALVLPATDSPASAPAADPPELDELTLEQARRGERHACRALVQRYERPVFALLSRMLARRAGPALVEDLAQETFLRVFRALPGFGRDGRLRLSSWILTIAARVALDELRRPVALQASLDDAAAVAVPRDADGDLERRRLGEAILHAVDDLAPEYRAAFLLRELHGLEYQEVAVALGIDLGTVKSRLSRARAALRLALARLRP